MKETAMAIIFIMFLVSSGYCETDDNETANIEYEIILKDGRSIKAKTCWEEGDILFYSKYGSTISLSKTIIEKVKKIKSDSDAQSGQDIDNKNNYTCTKTHCPQERRCFDEKISLNTVNIHIDWAEKRIAYLQKQYKNMCNIHKPGDRECDGITREIGWTKRGLECLGKVEFELEERMRESFTLERGLGGRVSIKQVEKY